MVELIKVAGKWGVDLVAGKLGKKDLVALDPYEDISVKWVKGKVTHVETLTSLQLMLNYLSWGSIACALVHRNLWVFYYVPLLPSYKTLIIGLH